VRVLGEMWLNMWGCGGECGVNVCECGEMWGIRINVEGTS
jgi:hypothetical protein